MTASAFQRGINYGKAQKRQEIISKLDAIKAEVSWNFETQIYQLIEELRHQTNWPHRANGNSSIFAHYELIEELGKEKK